MLESLLQLFLAVLFSPKQVKKMSVSVQQILADAKRLAGRLKDHDSSADLLLSQAQAMFCQVDAMKEVCWQQMLIIGFKGISDCHMILSVSRRVG